ncbi:dihydrodipicolinate synthase family protein [Paenibacillus mesophilus]|uniref:dihydrodipicolinate synthase family protein n=1 Tax=Paenibacillus mesophilus TaxID=2582849 RepID=UPI001305365C|nr:dihydrodipicolinate synthase family protein [Paenibacillus mesophilus]
MEQKIRVGVIGAGRQAQSFLKLYSEHPKVELTAVCDVSEERLTASAERWGVKHRFNDLSICECGDVDMISVHTPDHLHAESFIRALEGGKHVFVGFWKRSRQEKPQPSADPMKREKPRGERIPMVMQGNIPVIPTPFLQGKIEYAGFDRLFERTADYLEGYVVCGSTGEAPALTSAERKEIVRYIAARLPAEKHIVVGLGHTCLEEAIKIGRSAAEHGVKAALVPSPYYFPNSLDMVIDYIGKVAEGTGLDIVFYDNPVTTGTRFTAEDLLTLAKAVPGIKAIKMTDHSFAKIRVLKSKTGLVVFGGDDIICYRSFVAGVDGSMIIAPIIHPEAFRDCWRAFREGKAELSFRLYSEKLLPFISMFGPGDEIPTTKALFHHLGVFSSAETRSPLLTADSDRVREVLLGYGQIMKSGTSDG